MSPPSPKRGIFQCPRREVLHPIRSRERTQKLEYYFAFQAAARAFANDGTAVVSDASAVRTTGATRVPSSSIACINFACGRAATLIWNVRREMPPNESFTRRIFLRRFPDL